MKESSTPSASTSSPPTHLLTPCNLASRPRQPSLPGHQASPSHQTRQHFLRLTLMFCNCPAELCCRPELSPGLHSQRPPSTSPAWSPGSSGSSSPLPCPMVGILHPDNQHVPPEWLLRGFLFLHLPIGELITPLLHLSSMQMAHLLEKLGRSMTRGLPCQGSRAIEALGGGISLVASWQLCSAPSHCPLLFTAELPGAPFQRA